MKSLSRHINEAFDAPIVTLAKAIVNGDDNVDVLRYELKRSQWTDKDIDKHVKREIEKLTSANKRSNEIDELRTLQKIKTNKLSYAEAIRLSQLSDKYPNQVISKKVKWTDTKYIRLLQDAAKGSNGHTFDVAQNVLLEPGLIDFVKRNKIMNNETPEERVQWDIESYL